MTTPTLRAAVCARVSSDRQREDQTIESQLRDLPAYCARMGWRVDGQYTDDGESAKSGNLSARTNFARLLVDVAAGRYDVVVVAAIDRLTRAEDLTERGAILGAFQRGGCKIATPSGQMLDLATATGDLMATMQAFAAADWLRIHRERVRAGKLTAIARGRKPSGPTPYGYSYDRATSAWSIDPVTGPVVREIVERVIGGSSCYAIAADLDARGLRSTRGGRWSPERVWQIARAETYLGQWVAHRARKLTIAVPVLVTADEHAAARAVMIRHRKSGWNRTRHVYLLRDLATCGRCGAAIGIASATVSRTCAAPARYVCCLRRRATLRATEADRCLLPYHATADVDAAMWTELVRIVATPETAERRARRRRDRPAIDPAVELARATAEIKRLARAEALALDRHARGTITDAGLDAQLERLATARAAATSAQAAAERAAQGQRVSLAATTGLEDTLARVRVACEAATPAQRRELVQMLVPEAILGDTSLWFAAHLPAAMLGLTATTGLVSHPGYSSSAPSLRIGEGRVALPRRARRAS